MAMLLAMPSGSRDGSLRAVASATSESAPHALSGTAAETGTPANVAVRDFDQVELLLRLDAFGDALHAR